LNAPALGVQRFKAAVRRGFGPPVLPFESPAWPFKPPLQSFARPLKGTRGFGMALQSPIQVLERPFKPIQTLIQTPRPPLNAPEKRPSRP